MSWQKWSKPWPQTQNANWWLQYAEENSSRRTYKLSFMCAHNHLPFLLSLLVPLSKQPILHWDYEKKFPKVIKGHAIAAIWVRVRSSALEHKAFVLHSFETSAGEAHDKGQFVRKWWKSLYTPPCQVVLAAGFQECGRFRCSRQFPGEKKQSFPCFVEWNRLLLWWILHMA